MIFMSPPAFNSDLTFHQDNDVHVTVDFIPGETDGNHEARISLQLSESFIFWTGSLTRSPVTHHQKTEPKSIISRCTVAF